VRRPFKTRLLACFALAAFLLSVVPTATANRITFTLALKSAFVRGGPAFTAPRVASVFKGQTFAVNGRNADASWLRLDVPGVPGEAWLPASYGQVQGNVNDTPVLETTLPSALAAVATAAPPSAAPSAAPGARFTLTAKSAFARSAPSWNAQKVASLFKGQTFTALASSRDGQWVQIYHAAGPVWVAASAGKLSEAVPPVDEATPAHAAAVSAAGDERPPVPAWIPVITPHMREIYAQSEKNGRDPTAFALAGDCNSEPYLYTERVAGGLFDLTRYPYLIATKDRFYPSFLRKSVAVSGGFGAHSMFDPLWADPQQCQPGEGPFACELRVTNASLVFIQLGTGDHLLWREFEAHYRKMIDYALQNGVLPVLVTKADALESQIGKAPPDHINAVIRRLGQEYDVPVLDFALATQPYYNHGLQLEGGNDFHLSVDGIEAHILTTLQTLDVIWRSLLR
jgi:uncharacterized protein YraI